MKESSNLFKKGSFEYFYDPKVVSDSLSKAIVEGDSEGFHKVVKEIMKIVNKEELSRRSEVPIATIRRVAAGANFNVETMLKITRALRHT